MTADDDSVHVRIGYKETSIKSLDLISTKVELKPYDFTFTDLTVCH